MRSVRLPLWLKLACILIIIISTGYLAIISQQLLIPLLFSFLFAILLLPAANFFENKARLPRSIASFIAVLLFLISVSLIVYLLGSQIKTLSNEWPLLKAQLAASLKNLQSWMANSFHIDLEKQAAYINNATSNLVKSSGVIVEKTVLSLSSILLFLVLILIYTILLLFYRRILMRFIVATFTEKYIDVIYEIMEHIKHIIRKYISGLFFEMVIVAIIACIVFWILGIKYVFLLGLLVGVLNVIPYIGIFTAMLLSISITFATSDGRHALLVLITVILIHLFDSNFLMPKIVGSQVKINPLMVILGVIIGEMMFGISGMFLSIPYLAIAKVIFDRVKGLEPLGILLGEEEDTPRKVKRLIRKIKKKE